MSLRFPLRTLFALGIAVLAPAARAAAQSTGAGGALDVRDVLSIRGFADRVQVALSPDSRLVAFTLQNPARQATLEQAGSPYYSLTGAPKGHAGTDVLIADTRSGQTRSLTGDSGSSYSPAWSPDGHMLAFYSDRDGALRLWIWDRDRNVQRRVTADPVRPHFGFQGIHWSHDSRAILVKLIPEAMNAEALDRLLPTARAITATPRTTDPSGVTAVVMNSDARATAATPAPRLLIDLDSTRSFLNAELADLALIDVRSGRVRRVAPHVRVMGYRFSPDGSHIAFSTRQPDGGRGLLDYGTYDLFVTDTLGPPRIAVPRMASEYGLGFSWSPDGRSIAFDSGGAIHVWPLAGSASRRVTQPGVSVAHEYRPPLWLDSAGLLAIARDTVWRISLGTGATEPVGWMDSGRIVELAVPADAQRIDAARILVAVHDPATKRSGFARLGLTARRVTPLWQDDIALGGDPAYQASPSGDGTTLAFVAETGDRPVEIWIASGALTSPRRLTNLHPDVSRYRLGRSRLVRWTGSRGDTLRGALLLPSGYRAGTRYPLVVKLYGGSRLSGRLNRFGLEAGIDNLQMLATRGYAVLLPDAPLRVGTPMADLADAVMPGVDSVIAMGVADPARLGIMGHSYGGYSSLAVLVQSTRFKAGVSSGGFSSLLTHYAWMREDGSAVGIGWSERDQGRMGGSPWEFRDRYIENSPFFYLDRVSAPVLILHGSADRTVPVGQAEETFVALRRLGKAAELVRYEGEEHHPGNWSVANATDYWNRIIGWFDRYLVPVTP